MPDENIIPEAQPDASQLNAPDASGTVGSVPSDAMTLADINLALGKNFTTKEAALKSWKDTNSYVGMQKEKIIAEVKSELGNQAETAKLAQELEEMRKERFYDKNPQYANPSIRQIIEATGKNPAEVVETPAFKEIISKVSGYDESQKLKTVLESNPRLTSSRDALTKAREMAASNQGLQGPAKDEMESLVTNAVKDAYGL